MSTLSRMNAHAQLAARQDFDTRLFLPTWWVRAFSFVTSRQPQNLDALHQVWQTRVCPVMSDTELNALAMILSSLQCQILSGDGDLLRVVPVDHQKHASTASRSRLFTYSKMLQSIPGMRFMWQNGDEFIPVALFESERWPRNERDKHLYDLECKASELGVDLILGYSLSHLELVRRAQKKLCAEPLLGEFAPLSIWRSVWQELNVTEQSFLLRLEQAMQWECRWLHFDGIFGKNLFELLFDLDLRTGTAKSSDPHGQLGRVRVFLERLGKKLCHQGLLKFDIDEEYLALSAKEDSGAMLLWQASPQRVHAVEAEQYKKQCLKHFLLDRLTPQIEPLLDVLLANHTDAGWQKEEIHNAWMQMISTEWDPLFQTAFDIQPSVPVMALPLFFEWCIRQMPDHRFPLKDELADSDLGKLCTPDFGDGLSDRYRKFCYLLAENGEYRRGCEQDQMSSLSLGRALGQSDFRKYLAMFDRQKTASVRTKETAIKLDAPARPAAAVAAPTTSVEQRAISAPDMSSGLRKVAAHELQKIADTDLDTYKRLKESYMNSLDAGRKKLMLDMQQRMKPDQFETHLRHSLIKFMIDNPGLWKSAKAQPKDRRPMPNAGPAKPVQRIQTYR